MFSPPPTFTPIVEDRAARTHNTARLTRSWSGSNETTTTLKITPEALFGAWIYFPLLRLFGEPRRSSLQEMLETRAGEKRLAYSALQSCKSCFP